VTTRADVWPGGLVLHLDVTNTGSAWSSWTLTFTAPSGVQLTNGWSGDWSQSGNQITVRNASWNGSVNTGGSVQIGFQGTHTGTATPFTNFAVNGAACSS